MADDLGTLTVQGDLRSVRYTRVIDASPEELWDALTNPERIARWMLTEEMVLEPRVGGKSHFGWGKQGSADGTVTVYDPPRCLEYTWEEESGTSTVRFEISEVASGVELVLFHRDLAPKVAAGVGAGWHAHLDFLTAMLRDAEFDFGDRRATMTPPHATAPRPVRPSRSPHPRGRGGGSTPPAS
jgi:uncharacterized protein YndB with AHSA1/START domain